MASIKITDLAEQTAIAETDVIPVAGSDGVAKKVTLADLVNWIGENGSLSGTLTAAEEVSF